LPDRQRGGKGDRGAVLPSKESLSEGYMTRLRSSLDVSSAATDVGGRIKLAEGGRDGAFA